VAIVKRYGDDAMVEAAQGADQLLEEGNVAGAEAPDPERDRAVASAGAGGLREGA
jgi:hypothetical protein